MPTIFSKFLLEDDSNLAQEDQECPICLNAYEPGDQLCWSKHAECDHVFHRSCIEPWLMKHNQCPCCRCNYLAESPSSSERNATEPCTPAQGERNDTSSFRNLFLLSAIFDVMEGYYFGRRIDAESSDASSAIPRPREEVDVETGDTT